MIVKGGLLYVNNNLCYDNNNYWNNMYPDYEKITQALNFFIRKNSNSRINKLKAIKLLWAADRYHLRKYGRLLSRDDYYAMRFGPVASTADDIADLNDFYVGPEIIDYSKNFIGKDEVNHAITSHNEVVESYLSKTDFEALEFAWSTFGKFEGFKIADISHDYPEWSKFKSAIDNKLTKKEEIDPIDFFEDPASLVILDYDPFEIDRTILQSSKEAFIS